MDGVRVVAYSVRVHGATGDRQTDDTQAIQQAIDACHAAGGGTVVFPTGDYLTGTIRLKDRVVLWLDAGATIWASVEPLAYSTPYLIHALDARDVSIVGPGRIDGQGEKFWVRNGERWRPGPFRPESLVYFERCQNIVVRDVTITNSPSWTLHTFRCDNVVISGVTILNDIAGPNTDGIDPNCSTNVRISDCHIVAGDDCIVVKATEDYPCENVTVTNCTLETTCAALKLGTESHGDIRHCTFSNCTIRNTSAGITLYQKDGGTMEDVLFSNITIETKGDVIYKHREWPIFIDLERRGPDSKVGVIRDVSFSGITITTQGRCVVQGMATQPIERLTMENVTVKVVGFGDLEELPKPRGGTILWEDPEGGTHVAAPAHFVFANVRGLRLRDVQVALETDDPPQERSAVFGDSIHEVMIDGLRARQAVPEGSLPAVDLRDCSEVLVAGCKAPSETGTFLRFTGETTQTATVLGNDLLNAAVAVDVAADVPKEAVYVAANRLP